MVSWITNFIRIPNDTQIEHFLIATGRENQVAVERERSIKEFFLSNWHEPTMKPTVRKWMEYLKCILPVFLETAQVNYLLEGIVAWDNAFEFDSIEKFYYDHLNPVANMIYRRNQLKFLKNFKSIRWQIFKEKIYEIITSNNSIEFGGYKTYDSFLLDILDKMIKFFEKKLEIADEMLNKIKKHSELLLNMQLRGESKILLETAVNDFKNYIPTVANEIDIVAKLYEGAETKEEIGKFMKKFDDLMLIKKAFKNFYSTLYDAIDNFKSNLGKINKIKSSAAKNIYEQFKGIA